MNAPLKTPLPQALPSTAATRLSLAGKEVLHNLLRALVPPVLGIVLFIGVWALIATKSGPAWSAEHLAVGSGAVR